MKSEIDKDFYCSADSVIMGRSTTAETYVACLGECGKSNCGNYHRKWPTPEQYKEEYGEEYPDDAAVYFMLDDREDVWYIGALSQVSSGNYYRHEWNRIKKVVHIVCACTPFGKPDKDWRP